MKILPISRFVVHGNSMLPTLKPGDNVLVFNWAYLFSKPKVGDLVVFRMENRDVVKRIQKINGTEIFVIGDNEKYSTDSRKFGWVSRWKVKGKVVYITK